MIYNLKLNISDEEPQEKLVDGETYEEETQHKRRLVNFMSISGKAQGFFQDVYPCNLSVDRENYKLLEKYVELLLHTQNVFLDLVFDVVEVTNPNSDERYDLFLADQN